MAIVLRLKQLRQKAGATQIEISRLLGVSREAYSMYEAGKRQPGLETLDVIAAHYEVTLDYLVGRVDCPDAGELLAEEERIFLLRYRALDARGKHAVAGLAQLETVILAQKDSE